MTKNHCFLILTSFILFIGLMSCSDDAIDDPCTDFALLNERLINDFDLNLNMMPNIHASIFCGTDILCEPDSATIIGMSKNSTISIDVSDPDFICDETLDFSTLYLYEEPTYGNALLNGTTITYTPNRNFVGEDVIRIYLKPKTGTSSPKPGAIVIRIYN